MSDLNSIKVFVRPEPDIKIGFTYPTDLDGGINVNVRNDADIRVVLTQPYTTPVVSGSFILFAETSISSSYAQVADTLRAGGSIEYDNIIVSGTLTVNQNTIINGTLTATSSNAISASYANSARLGDGIENRLPLWVNNTYLTSSLISQVNNKIGINISSPDYELHVSGVIFATDNVVAASDRRIKKNIETLENALYIVSQMRGVTYHRIENSDNSKKSVGFIAQEVNEILPEVVVGSEIHGYGVNYGSITAVLVEAVKELKASIDEIKSKS